MLLGADVMFLIIHIALKLLMFQHLDSAHTMCVYKFQLVMRKQTTVETERFDYTAVLGLSIKY